MMACEEPHTRLTPDLQHRMEHIRVQHTSTHTSMCPPHIYYTLIHIHTYIHIYARIHIYKTHIHIHINTHTHVHTHTCTNTYTHTHAQSFQTAVGREL